MCSSLLAIHSSISDMVFGLESNMLSTLLVLLQVEWSPNCYHQAAMSRWEWCQFNNWFKYLRCVIGLVEFEHPSFLCHHGSDSCAEMASRSNYLRWKMQMVVGSMICTSQPQLCQLLGVRKRFPNCSDSKSNIPRSKVGMSLMFTKANSQTHTYMHAMLNSQVDVWVFAQHRCLE